jgi:hypothetical protein
MSHTERGTEMTTSEKQMKSAVKKYNEIMEILGYDYSTIGTSLSEDTEAWNLRDMVAECDYILLAYYENGYFHCEMRLSDDESKRKARVSYVGRLKRFINHWLPYIKDMKCAVEHFSQYD